MRQRDDLEQFCTTQSTNNMTGLSEQQQGTETKSRCESQPPSQKRTTTAAAAAAVASFFGDSTSDVLSAVLALAVIERQGVLDGGPFLQGVAVRDGRDVAENVFAARVGLDESEATVVPAQSNAGLDAIAASSTGTGTTTAAARAGTGAGAGAAARGRARARLGAAGRRRRAGAGAGAATPGGRRAGTGSAVVGHDEKIKKKKKKKKRDRRKTNKEKRGSPAGNQRETTKTKKARATLSHTAKKGSFRGGKGRRRCRGPGASARALPSLCFEAGVHCAAPGHSQQAAQQASLVSERARELSEGRRRGGRRGERGGGRFSRGGGSVSK